MKKLTSNEIRKLWLSFFASKNHQIIAGANLIPHNDKTLLWINSGVAALKPYFDGSKVPSSRRLVNVQKSIRTNDIENVGVTNRHHTFFEMLGNFSLGDYFRTEAIKWGYEFLTSKEWLGLPVVKLYFTYHPSDTETREEWLKLGIPETHIIPAESNYWEIGEGPCGPNTEIFFDLGQDKDPTNKGTLLLEDDIDNERFVEIWNIVFSQYNAKAGVKREDYEELPSKNIDTGAGLERIASVMQGTVSNFETDLFLPTINKLEKLSKTKYNDYVVSYRVISDHIRTCVFALSDGASFSNEGRGYVLRRLLRRAMLHGQKLNLTKPFLSNLVDEVIVAMESFYPELNENAAKVKKLIEAEENRFLRTLKNGERIVRDLLEKNKKLTGQETFMLYDTYGFPFELTREIAFEYNVELDQSDFTKHLEAQKERARKARSDSNSMQRQSKDLLSFVMPSLFDEKACELTTNVTALFKDGIRVKEDDEVVEAIFSATPFYAESGGQVSDLGQVSGTDFLGNVVSLFKAPHGQHVHKIEILYGTLKEGMEVTLTIDQAARNLIKQNHTATHLLHQALNVVLGGDANQAGSYVGSDYLRFDFTHDKKVTDDELAQIETLVQQYINASIPLEITVLPLESALKLGAKALFGEKYSDDVRVVKFGDISLELCGGTHVENTSFVTNFAIVSESSIASGVRRIEAVSGLKAYEHHKKAETFVKRLANILSVKDNQELLSAVRKLRDDNEHFSRELKKLKMTQLQNIAKEISYEKVKDVNLYLNYYRDFSREDLMTLSDFIKEKDESALIVLLAPTEKGQVIHVAVSKKMTTKYHAGKLLQTVTKHFGGTGGGRPDFANGALTKNVKIDELNNYMKELLDA
ncbi:MAG TPA: alanine--tRNA ligase [Bacilli bacterium]|nr:alanine--tRNA ligase [Bacilli bacterium]